MKTVFTGWRSIAPGACSQWSLEECVRFKLADSLKGTFEHWEHTIKAEPEEMSEEQRSMMMDIGSLWRINWDELAKAFLS